MKETDRRVDRGRRRARRLPTHLDVARLSGVSTATVSRVLNSPELVKKSTRKKVEEAMVCLDYTPHFGARALASNRTNTIGAVIPTMENAIFALGLQVLQEELAEAGATLLVATSNYDADREMQQIRTLLGRGVEGIVLIGEARKPEAYRLLQRRDIPFVLVWSWTESCNWPCVGFDNFAAARSIAERVVAAGHRHIAMIAGIGNGNDRATARVLGVRAALQAAGLQLESRLLIEAEYTLDAGAAAARHLLSTGDRPTAIVCGNDVLAAGALTTIRAAGLQVPMDISLTGFDDIELARLLTPPLTTVRVPHRRMGQTAARLLLQLLNSQEEPTSVVFETKVVERASLAPVQSSPN